MKKFRRSQFTLIELLAVIGILSLLIGVFAPAFSRMMVGSKVDQMASNFKTGMEVAQAKAVASRRYVAMILPNNYDTMLEVGDMVTVYYSRMNITVSQVVNSISELYNSSTATVTAIVGTPPKNLKELLM